MDELAISITACQRHVMLSANSSTDANLLLMRAFGTNRGIDSLDHRPSANRDGPRRPTAEGPLLLRPRNPHNPTQNMLNLYPWGLTPSGGHAVCFTLRLPA